MAEPLTEPSPRPASRWALALFVALPVLLAVVPRDLWPPEEPRFGRCAHEMATEGDWLVTRLNGYVDAEKPPLLFWMMAGVERLVGAPTPLGMRLPGALLASLAILATARLARRWFGDRDLAVTAAILFAGTPLVLWNAPRVGMDLGLAAFSVLALEGATTAILDASWGGALRMGLAIGLGLLLKGPHVLYVPLGGAACGAFSLRGRATADQPGPGGGAAVRTTVAVLFGVALFASWLVPALLLRGHEVLDTGVTYRQRLLGQIGSRVSGEGEPHRRGVLFLVPTLLLCGLPWILFAASAVRAAFRSPGAPRAERFGLFAAIGAVVVPLVLLSIPGSKRETYLIPLLPCVAILAAFALHRLPLDAWGRGCTAALAPGLAVLGAGIALLPILGPRLAPGDRYDAVTGRDLASGPAIAVCALLALGLAFGARFAWRSRATPVLAARGAGISLACVLLGAAGCFLPRFDPAMTLADAAVVAHRAAPGAPISYAGTADNSALTLWAMGVPRVGHVDDQTALAKTLASDAPRALVLVKGRFWTDRAKSDQHPTPENLAILDRARVLWERRVGGDTWHLLTNAAP